MRNPLYLVVCLTVSTALAQSNWPIETPANLLDLHHEPTSATDRTHEIFFDQGAWHGYSLPCASDTGTGFVGPFLSATGPGLWAGRRIAVIHLTDSQTHQAIPLVACDHGGTALPGALTREACAPGLTVTETLFYASASTALVRITLRPAQVSTYDITLSGEQALKEIPNGDLLRTTISGSPVKLVETADGYTLTVSPNRAATIYLQQTYIPACEGAALKDWSGSPDAAWRQAIARWQQYLRLAANIRPDLASNEAARRINTEAVITLLANWRAPLGDLHHQGVFPSYSNPDFNAFWSWDGWKHAAALAHFAPSLAEDQVRALFDYQLPKGMVPDMIARDRKDNNLRDTKPPLATWAVAEIYSQNHDRAFIAEMFPKLYGYHRWWYQDRDHDHNGLAEFGSTDGTREAAGWESGMDNAVRFDDATMLKNHDGAWSLNQESVDLNCYLYQEKLELASMAAILGKQPLARKLRHEAASLRTQIQQTFFDPTLGYFFDTRLGSHQPIRVFGPEGWTALFTGVATTQQAQSVAEVLMDPAKFNTLLPFPTLARDDSHFAPAEGYWRGPVWIDQAAFAIQGLERYGLTTDAAAMREKLLTNAEGLARQEPFRETYNPLTGAGQNSRNFSWSAAEYFLLLHPRPNPD